MKSYYIVTSDGIEILDNSPDAENRIDNTNYLVNRYNRLAAKKHKSLINRMKERIM